MKIFASPGLGFFHVIRESIELAFQDRVVPVQYIRQCGKRPIVRIVARHWREFIVQRQSQLEFQNIAHGVSRWCALIGNSTDYRMIQLDGQATTPAPDEAGSAGFRASLARVFGAQRSELSSDVLRSGGVNCVAWLFADYAEC